MDLIYHNAWVLFLVRNSRDGKRSSFTMELARPTTMKGWFGSLFLGCGVNKGYKILTEVRLGVSSGLIGPGLPSFIICGIEMCF